MDQPIQGVYRHFKGKYYMVIASAYDCTNEKDVILYYCIDDPYKIYTRYSDEFFSNIDIKRADNITKQSVRFKKVKLN